MKETSYETDIMLELKDDDVLDQGVYSESGERQIDYRGVYEAKLTR